MSKARVLFVLLLAAISSADAGPSPVPHGKVELIPEVDHVQPGAPFPVGLHFQLEPGWHIYWKNPGDSGQPPRVQWNLPAGFSAGSIEWPVPKRLPVGPLLDYGYEDDVLLPLTIQTDQSLKSSGPVELKGNLRVLVCREICIPGKASLNLSVPIRPQPAKPVANNERLFARARDAMPLPQPPEWRTSTVAAKAAITLKIQGLKESRGISFFPAQPDVIENAAPQQVSQTADSVAITLKRPGDSGQPPSRLEGLLVVPSGDGATHGYEVSANVAASSTPAPAPAQSSNLLFVMGFAFLGGLILNLMPCVFPVLSLKALHLLESADKDARTVRLSAFAYTIGVLVSCWILVGVLLALRAGGSHLGWGFQLQSPPL